MGNAWEILGDTIYDMVGFPWFSMSKQAQRRVAEQQREAVKRTDRAPDKAR